MRVVREHHKVEEKALLSLIDEEVEQLFREVGAIVAGGAITSLFTRSEVNDLDVYFPSEEALFHTVAAIFGKTDYHPLLFKMSQFKLVYGGMSQNTLMFQTRSGQDVQMMTFKWFKNPQEIFNTFDYTCCMGAFEFSTGDFVLHKDFLKHNAQRYLKFNPGTAYPMMSMMRVDKYRQKGYKISKTELIRVLGACMQLNLSSWEEAKKHVGGMYGYDLNDVFDEKVEFSIEEMMEQLSNINERDIKEWIPASTEKDLWTIAKQFCEIPYIPSDVEEYDDEKYIYKCVDDQYRSPLASIKKISYYQGQLLDTRDTGKLYFNRSFKDRFYSSPYCVEAELIKGEAEEDPCVGKIVVEGVVKIVRTFESEDIRGGDDAFTKYLKEKYKVNRELIHEQILD